MAQQLNLFRLQEEQDANEITHPEVDSPESTGTTSSELPGDRRGSDKDPGDSELETKTKHLADQLGRLLGDRLGSLVLTENRRRILSAKAMADGRLAVRIHRCFTEASSATLEQAAAFLDGRLRKEARKRALVTIRQHFDLHAAPEPAAAQRQPSLQPIGRHFDLSSIRDRVNQEYFDPSLEVAITWGRANRSRGQRSIRLGSYQAGSGIIRIHRALDQHWVPGYVVEAIVYHEMLHAAIPPEARGSRRSIHTPEFRRRERLHPDFEASEQWLRKNLNRLLGSKRSFRWKPCR